MTDEITVILGIDTETDMGSWYHTYEGLQRGVPLLLQILTSQNIPATFFVTGDAAQKHPDAVRPIADAGFEVGCHSIYHETLGDPLFEIPGVTPLLPEEVENRLRVATELVARSVGGRPVSFRCPRLCGSTRVVNALDKLGYLADATYPLYYYEKRLVPYHPSSEDWTREGDLSILEIPNFADMTITSQDAYGRDRDQWPLFRTEGAEALMEHVDNFATYVRDRGLPVVLCFYFHPWEFVEMPASMYIGEGTVTPDPLLSKNCGPYALEQFQILIDLLKARNAQFTTSRRLAQWWPT